MAMTWGRTAAHQCWGHHGRDSALFTIKNYPNLYVVLCAFWKKLSSFREILRVHPDREPARPCYRSEAIAVYDAAMKDDVAPNRIGTPVTARLAASLLVMQRSGPVVRVLMARRAAHHRFMPGVLVFPGGAVDEADAHARAATPLRPAVRTRLERGVTPALAHALAIAAARELTEEVGLSLGDPPSLDGFDYLCRAITPPDRAMRFDAHFFLVDADHVSGTLAASAELEEPAWYTLEEANAGELAGATRAVLWQFNRWLTHHDRDGLVPVLRDRVWTHE
jgi:8-oxo-dGTP pyrophosphatase MutT (NUDIX family)